MRGTRSAKTETLLEVGLQILYNTRVEEPGKSSNHLPSSCSAHLSSSITVNSQFSAICSMKSAFYL